MFKLFQTVVITPLLCPLTLVTAATPVELSIPQHCMQYVMVTVADLPPSNYVVLLEKMVPLIRRPK